MRIYFVKNALMEVYSGLAAGYDTSKHSPQVVVKEFTNVLFGLTKKIINESDGLTLHPGIPYIGDPEKPSRSATSHSPEGSSCVSIPFSLEDVKCYIEFDLEPIAS